MPADLCWLPSPYVDPEPNTDATPDACFDDAPDARTDCRPVPTPDPNTYVDSEPNTDAPVSHADIGADERGPYSAADLGPNPDKISEPDGEPKPALDESKHSPQ